jgi:diguanylate cyclase (GGDEF)-like protein
VSFGHDAIATLAICPRGTEDPQDARVIDVIARELGGPLRMALLVEEEQHAATTDPLTGIMNRRALLSALDMEQTRSGRHGYPMSLLMLDVDHFKAINDQFGHAMGDRVLASLGRLLVNQLRNIDFVGRWGGEEFVAVLSGADERSAHVIAERIRSAVEKMEVSDEKRGAIPVRVSIGIACLQPNDATRDLIERADRAMYQAKSTGRNRVAVSPGAMRCIGAQAAPPAAPS